MYIAISADTHCAPETW